MRARASEWVPRARTAARGGAPRTDPELSEGRPRGRRRASLEARNARLESRGGSGWTALGASGVAVLLTLCCPHPCPAGTESQASSEIAVLHRLDPRVPAFRFAEDVRKDLETVNAAIRSKWQQSVPPKLLSSLGSPSEEAEGQTESSSEVEENRSLLRDLWDVVDRNYYAVGNAFPLDHQQWKETLETTLRDVDLRDRASTFRAAEKMLKSVSSSDRYTRFLMPAEFDRLKRYDASGVGVNLCSDEEYLRRAGRGDAPTVDVVTTGNSLDGEQRGRSLHAPRVLGLVPGSPADKAGLKQGDQVLEINGFPIDGDVSPWEATEKFQSTATGQAFATVTILKGQGGDLATLQIKLPDRQAKREYTTTSSFLLSSSPWGDRVGVVRLSEMGATTPKEVKDRVQSLLQEGIDGLLIDLRGNRGGLVPSAIEVARMFLHNDQRAVIAAGGIADPLAAQEVLQGIEQVPYNLPVVLQVDGGTASAAEILVGALRDNCRAIVVGTHNTFGKGIVQSVYALPQGAGLVLTVGAYQTPAMRPIHLVGMPPDFRDVPTVAEAREVLDRCSRESFEK